MLVNIKLLWVLGGALGLSLSMLPACRDPQPIITPPEAERTPELVATQVTPPADAPHYAVVKARHRDGVPAHPAAHSASISHRIADGSRVEVIESDAQGRWLHVRDEQGRTGWITSRYVPRSDASSRSAARAAVAAPGQPDSPWASPEACDRALQGRGPRDRSRARLATWNIRWFPDGTATGGRADRATNVTWLACAIALLDVDVLGVQEILRTPSAQRAMRELLREVDKRTGGKWRAEFDSCPAARAQHVGLLYDSARVRLSESGDYAVLNPTGQACGGSLRPGFGAYIKWTGGLDLHFITVHLDSGKSRKDIASREVSIQSIASAAAIARAKVADDDVIVAGDFNTMGCLASAGCGRDVETSAELARARRALEAGRPPFRLLESAPGCTEYYDGQPALLDFAAVSSGMQEVGPAVRAIVSGYCAAAACGPLKELPRAYHELSDHCPVVVELPNRDLD